MMKMGWEVYVAVMGETINEYKICVVKVKVSDHLKELGVDGAIILQWISEK